METLTKEELRDIAYALDCRISSLVHYAEENGTSTKYALKLATLRDKINAQIDAPEIKRDGK